MLILKADQVKHPNKSSDSVLFTAVLTQAIHDSLYKGSFKYYIQYKIEAIKWLTGNSRDFKLICNYADIDPEYAYEKFTKAMKEDIYKITDQQLKALEFIPKPKKYVHSGQYKLRF
tara:strand:+ start:86 stop:433 length:348 start_codon:yes stop_codon:yes gene_type:complete